MNMMIHFEKFNHSNHKSIVYNAPLKNLTKLNDSFRLLRVYGLSHEDSRGFIEADNSGRSNIFSTGEKALYSYSPVAEDSARRGLGGGQGIGIIIAVIVIVGIITANITTEKESIETWSVASSRIDSLTEIVS